MSRAFARIAVKLRFAIVVGWVAVTVASVIALPSIGDKPGGALGDMVASDAEAIAAEVRAYELFRFPILSRTIVVQRDPDGMSTRAQLDVAERAVAIVAGTLPRFRNIPFAIAVTNALGEPPFSRERSTTALTYLFFAPRIGREGRTGLARLFVARQLDDPDDAPVGVTGALPARTAQVHAIDEALPTIHLATVALVLFVVAFHFRAPGAPLVNLAAVAVSFLVASRVLAAIGDVIGLGVPSEIEPVLLVLLFGVVTDYSIFLMTRFRRLVVDEPGPVAAERSTREMLPIIVIAGMTIVATSATLLVSRLEFFQVFGPGLAIAVLIGLLVSVTLVPALLAIGGRLLLWPGGSEPASGGAGAAAGRGINVRLLRLAAHRPLAVSLAAVAVLLAMASGLARMNVGNPIVRGLADDSDVKQAYEAASEGFTPGILSPTLVLVEGPRVTGQRGGLRRLQSLLARERGVAQVVGPREQPAPVAFGAALSRTGNAARYALVLESDPLGNEAIEAVRALRQRIPELVDAAGLRGVRVALAGDTAISEETVTESRQDFARVGPAALVITFVLLALLLRALVAPLYLVTASVLALMASLGLTVYLFQDVAGHAEIVFFVPFVAAVLLVALGSDYNVFFAGRVWTEALNRPLREAVIVGGSRAAGAISAAALVLAASFALLAFVPLNAFRELAFAVSAGLLIDAFLVRTLLVPALIVLVGERSGWPGGGLSHGPGRGAGRGRRG